MQNIPSVSSVLVSHLPFFITILNLGVVALCLAICLSWYFMRQQRKREEERLSRDIAYHNWKTELRKALEKIPDGSEAQKQLIAKADQTTGVDFWKEIYDNDWPHPFHSKTHLLDHALSKITESVLAK